MADAIENTLSKFQLISISKVKPSRHQARKQFNEEGLIEPIVVRPVGDEFELVSGERRLRACKLNGLESIEAKVIQTVSEAEASIKGLIENLQREDLNPIEEAQGFQEMLSLNDSHPHIQFSVDYGKKGHWTIKGISNKSLDLVICDFDELVSQLSVLLQQFRNNQ